MKLIETTLLPLSAIEPNRGQIEGLPKNPRALRDGKFDALKKSIIDNPEMLALRELLVFKHGEKYIIIGGNMRYRALKDLKYKDAPCKVIPADTPVETLRAYVIKDNGDFGEWDFDQLANEWEAEDLDEWGLDVWQQTDNYSDDDAPHQSGSSAGEDADDKTDDTEERDKLAFYRSMLSDVIYESNNIFDIPTLLLDQQAGKLELPCAPYGADSRLHKDIATYHFYVDDYRFEAIWKDPSKVLQSGCRSLVEPNCSLFDTTPVAYGLMQIYKKRWIARYFQSCGIKVYADLNVSSRFYEYNRMGIPDGYNAFFTRGYSDRLSGLLAEIEIAKQISGRDAPNMVIYGGGGKAHEIAAQHNLTYIEQFINSKKYGKE